MGRLLIIIFALAVVLAAGTVGLIHFGIIPDFTGMLGVAVAPVEEKVEAPPPPPREPEPLFVDLEPLQIPVIRNGAVDRTLFVTVRLRVPMEKGPAIQPSLPVLRDVYLKALYELVPEQYSANGRADLEVMKARLKQLANRVIGEGSVEDVLFGAVYER